MRWAESTWEEIAAIPRGRLIGLLPVGATEAHGPHLAVGADVTIAEAMAGAALPALAAAGWEPRVLPALAYTPAPFARAFPGTLAIRPQTLVETVVDLADALADHRAAALAIANSHLDPEHLAALETAVARIAAAGRLRVAFPNLVRRRFAERLGEEFRSGACHAGRFETSIVLAARPAEVRVPAARGLPPNPRSLVEAMRAGHADFASAGGPRAYFGDPAAASREEGDESVRILGDILAEATLAALAAPAPGGDRSAAGDGST